MELRVALLLLGVLASIPAQAQSTQAKPKEMRLDGPWWRVLAADEKWGYIEGHEDCWRVDAKNARKARWATVPALVAAVDDYYEKHPIDIAVAVHEILNRVDATVPSTKPAVGAEVFTNRHGYVDGTWWAGGSSLSQVGFLEGYLSCQLITGKPLAVFSKPLASYQKSIDGYIALHPSAYNEALAEILYRFRD